MSLVPQNRPDGSTQVLRYRGNLTVSQGNSAAYPKPPAEIPSDSAITGASFLAYVRFPFFDPTDAASIANARRRFPEFCFDDAQPAADSPHAPVACTASATPGVNPTDLSMNRQTWAQNVEVTVRSLSQKLELADSGMSIDEDVVNGAEIVLDTLDSGLGLDTGLPVLIVALQIAADDGALQACPIDLTIEIRKTSHR